eukprot:CAMPEP_0183790280 /NCGR_PEP_ID=MMETSP0803_2-20130417/925_1 /TAXON_ID=195967 /ORGANISM="Crustomastix stigmata, Strain CCMP3273" /LENGTH=148 /DNA_ID=CAMNT_0026034483 /DNA_START=389 /DNA_END=832 /DNA_ORIENTATION=+
MLAICVQLGLHTFQADFETAFLNAPLEEEIYPDFKEKITAATIVAYSDADHGGCLDTSRSTTGGLCYLFGMLYDWLCTLQDGVSKSTTEAEYVALSVTNNQLIQSLTSFLESVNCSVTEPGTENIPLLYGDNMGFWARLELAHVNVRR